jgi:hypothetical protein
MVGLPWRRLAVAGPVLVSVWFVAGQPGPKRLDIPNAPNVDLAVTVILCGICWTAGCLLWNRRTVLGAALVAAALIGAGMSLWFFPGTRWSGPVVFTLDASHGIHLIDFLALVPHSAALAVLWLGLRAWRSQRTAAG